MLPPNYRIRLVAPTDYDAIIEICKLVYPSEEPYTAEELEDHRQVFPQGQFVAIEETRNAVAGVHFTLRLSLMDFHIDDPWDILTAGGTFLDHNPQGPTLYGADIMVHPGHQHHGIAHALTDQVRFLVQEEKLFFIVEGQPLKELKNRKALLAQFPDHEESLEKYMKKQKTDFKDDQDLRDLFAYLNTILP